MATTTQVPGRYPISINGRTFLIDLASEAFNLASIETIRQQGDSSSKTGESTINPNDLWRTSISSWKKGGGQKYFDKDDSDPARFYKSRRVNVWEDDQLTLLELAQVESAGTHTDIDQFRVGDYLYRVQDLVLSYQTSVGGSSTTVHTFTAPTYLMSHATDGYNVWMTQSPTAGIWATTRGATSGASYITSTTTSGRSILGFAKGRLLFGNENTLYNITAGGTLPVTLSTGLLLTHPNTDFTWTAFAEGPSCIYAGGVSGTQSTIYKVTIQPDGSALGVPTQVEALPDGEVLTALLGYQGFLLIGTTKGFRLAQISDDGSFTFGPLVNPQDAAGIDYVHGPQGMADPGIRCFEAQENFVWFGIDQIDYKYSSPQSVTAGLGRMDLSVFTAALVPAYAIGAEVTYADGVGITFPSLVNSVNHFQDQIVFSLWDLNGSGNSRPEFVAVDKPAVPGGSSTEYYADGYVESGLMTFGLGDLKAPGYLETVIATDPTIAGFTAVQSTVNTDEPNSQTLGAISNPPGAEQLLSLGLARTMSIKTVLTAPHTILTPVISRLTLRAEPEPRRSALLTLPLILADEINAPGGYTEPRDPADDFQYLVDLVLSPSGFIDLQFGQVTVQALTQNFKWVPDHLQSDESFWNGTFVLIVKITG